MFLRILTPLTISLLFAGTPGAQLSFTDSGSAAGIARTSWGRGTGMSDLDGDGLLDLVTADSAMSDAVYRQNPDGTFTDMTALWGYPTAAIEIWGTLLADFDNDGDDDAFQIVGGYGSGILNNVILRNDLAGIANFVDVSALSPDATRSEANFGGAALDYDRDGLLDVFLTTSYRTLPCTLLRNTGGFVFQDVSTGSGITHPGGYRHCGAADFDDDGWADVAAGAKGGENVLYRNLGNGSFSEMAQLAGVASWGPNFGFVFTDFDNNGLLDAFVPQYEVGPSLSTTKVFMNQGLGVFSDVSVGSGLASHADMGHDAGDLDADGYPDIYIGTGSPDSSAFDVLYTVVPDGLGGIIATDVTGPSGVLAAGRTRTHGTALGDVDRDGDIDVFCGLGGPARRPESMGTDILWTNAGNGNSWVVLELEGVLSNRSAVGARAMAVGDSGRKVHRDVQVGRGFANSPDKALHFGLGSETGVNRIELRWPSGVRQVVLAPALASRTQVLETGMRLQGTPALGGTLALELCGTPAHAADFFLSPNTTSLPVPLIGGILELGAPILTLGTTALDSAGRGSFSLPIPSDPTLAGQTFYVQSVLHAAGTLAGAVLTPSIAIAL